MATANFTAALPLGRRLTLQPALNLGWCSAYSGQINFIHTLSAGGLVAGRYLENQLPFFGYSTGCYIFDDVVATAQLDLRCEIGHANLLSLQGAVLNTAESFREFFRSGEPVWAVGLEYGRKTIAGPLRLGVHWCDATGIGATLSFGFDF